MEIEVRELGKTHVQFFLAGVCLGTVRVEYADAFKAVIEQKLSADEKTNAG